VCALSGLSATWASAKPSFRSCFPLQLRRLRQEPRAGKRWGVSAHGRGPRSRERSRSRVSAIRTVNPVNSDHIIAQAGQEAALTKMVTRGETPDGMAYTRTVQLNDVGGEILEQWVLHGAGHAWSGGSVSGYLPPAVHDQLRSWPSPSGSRCTRS
jgi:hypothetical protein